MATAPRSPTILRPSPDHELRGRRGHWCRDVRRPDNSGGPPARRVGRRRVRAEGVGCRRVRTGESGVLRTSEYPPADDDSATAWRNRVPWLSAAAVVLVVVTVVVVGITVRGRTSHDSSGTPTASSSQAAPPSSTAFSDSMIAGDASKFVGDITIPDGTRVRVNEEFDKVWALANVGKVDWHNRFLARMDPTADGDGCQTPDRVPIGDTPPGEQVMIRVRVTAPSRPGKCWVSWKMVDENGQEYFPTRRPVYFMVTVTA
ncbi:NBR1-Ig-like domain-containing protein [Micromonospora sp. M12]